MTIRRVTLQAQVLKGAAVSTQLSRVDPACATAHAALGEIALNAGLRLYFLKYPSRDSAKAIAAAVELGTVRDVEPTRKNLNSRRLLRQASSAQKQRAVPPASGVVGDARAPDRIPPSAAAARTLRRCVHASRMAGRERVPRRGDQGCADTARRGQRHDVPAGPGNLNIRETTSSCALRSWRRAQLHAARGDDARAASTGRSRAWSSLTTYLDCVQRPCGPLFARCLS